MRMQEWVAQHMAKENVAFVTGACSGIGYEYARALSAAGCNLICLSNDAPALAARKAALEGEFNNRVETIDVDLRDVAATKRVAAALAGRPIKILINNAGFGLKGRFENNEVDDYVDIVTVNAIAPVVFARAILPQMQQQGRGVVMHVASINAVVPIPNNQVYTATKAFIASYASAVARENKRSELKFQLVLPGTTRTPFHDRQGAKPKNLVMEPQDVVRESFADIDAQVCIPNRADRVVAKLIPFMPRNAAMDLAAYMLKKRLGI